MSIYRSALYQHNNPVEVINPIRSRITSFECIFVHSTINLIQTLAKSTDIAFKGIISGQKRLLKLAALKVLVGGLDSICCVALGILGFFKPRTAYDIADEIQQIVDINIWKSAKLEWAYEKKDHFDSFFQIEGKNTLRISAIVETITGIVDFFFSSLRYLCEFPFSNKPIDKLETSFIFLKRAVLFMPYYGIIGIYKGESPRNLTYR